MKQSQSHINKGIILTLFLGLFNISTAQTQSMKAWENLLNKPKLAEYFSGVFEKIGIHVVDTDERFTVHHKGDHFTLAEGATSAGVDYFVPINSQNIKNMAQHGKDAEIDMDESFRIMSVLFTPMTASSLNHPIMKRSVFGKIPGIENLMHVYLVHPNGQEIAEHTLIYINKEWVVAAGALGTSKRTFRMTPDDALTYQREFFKTMKKNRTKDWRKFRKWYKQWRAGVSKVQA